MLCANARLFSTLSRVGIVSGHLAWRLLKYVYSTYWTLHPANTFEMVDYTYCPHCTARLTEAEHGGRIRKVCTPCGFIRYRNPTVGVAVVLMRGDTILLGRRAPGCSYEGKWCIPCGHVEWDEDIRLAGIREFEEETGMKVELGEVVAVHSNFHNLRQHTVGVWFAATEVGGDVNPGDDIDKVAFFELDKTPTEPQMAFPTDLLVLQQLRDRLNQDKNSES